MINQEIETLFSKTKILATLGPATANKNILKELIQVGVDGVRLNFSHGDYSFYGSLFQEIHAACEEESKPIAVFLDLQGPKIRIGDLKKTEIEIISGDEIEITNEIIKGDAKKISTSYFPLPEDANINDLILIDDGLIKLKVKAKTKNSVVCEIINGGILKPKKGMNLPGMKLSTPSITEKDWEDLKFAVKYRVDYVGLSFVRKPEEIIELKNWLKENKLDIKVIAKIEKKEGVDNFESILQVADGIMVARGDLGVELQPQDVPIVQKKIIKRCNEVGKLVITATQMLESMVNNPIPTRAEASDVANAVWDGTDVVMLSAETSVGKFPIRTVQIMNDIICNAEKNVSDPKVIKFVVPIDSRTNLFDSMNRGIVAISNQVKAKAIVAFSTGGNTPNGLSKYRPDCLIIAISDNFDTMNALCLKRGVVSLFQKNISYHSPQAIEDAKVSLINSGLVKKGDLIVFTAGGERSATLRENWIRFETL